MASPIVVAVLLVYLAFLFAIGVWGGRESKTIKGYFVADKKLPSWVIAFSVNATGESAWLLLGLTGMGYAVGIHALWIVLGEVLGVTFAWLYVARPFKAFSDHFDCITVPDFLESRLADTRHLLRIISAIIIFAMVTAYVAAQLTAAGKAFDSFLGTGYLTGVFIGAAIVLFYTTVGGFKAVAYSDVLQGVLMFGCLLALPIVGFVKAGGWSQVMTKLAAEDPALLMPMGTFGFTVEGVVSVVGFIGIGLAFLGAPQLLTRFMSAKDDREIVRASLPAVVCIVVFDIGAVASGMAGRVLFPGLEDSETILPTMSAELFPPVFTGIFLVVVLAAIMSTVDSLLILASSSLVRDVLQKTLGSRKPDAVLTRYGKAATVMLGLVALVFALSKARLLFWFILFAWSGLACAFVPVVLCAVFWRRTTLQGALAGMVGGFVVTVVWVVAFKTQFYNLYEMLPGFAAGLALTIVVSLMTHVPDDVRREFDEVRRRQLDQESPDP